MKASIFVALASVGVLASCSYSINMVHTQGTASDVVDETQTPTADVDATANIPVSGV